MLDVLRFVFSSLWTFLGTLLLVAAILEGLTDLARAIRGNPTSGWLTLRQPKDGKHDAN